MSVQEVLKGFIKEKGIKHKFIADRLGFNDNAFSQIINGKRRLTADDLIDILLIIGVDPNEFVNKALQERKKDNE